MNAAEPTHPQIARCREGLGILIAAEITRVVEGKIHGGDVEALAIQLAAAQALASEQGRNLIRELNSAEMLFVD